MRITRIEIEGFGCLRDFREDIASGLHLFQGPNESGKSTLQQSILALLYGFYEGERARASENAARERFVPWSGPPYGGTLEYELENGVRYRVQRDFNSSDVPTTVWDLGVGRDVTGDFGRGRHGNVPFARRHIGMTRRVFDACAFVSQGELFEIAEESRASPQEIGDTIISLADTARRDISAQSAIGHLDHILREQVGTRMSRTTPLPVTRRRAAEAERELQEIDGVRGELADQATDLEEAIEGARELREAVSRTRYLLLSAEAADVEDRLGRLEDLARQDERLQADIDGNRDFAEFPADERDSVLKTWGSICDLREGLDKDRPGIAETRARLLTLGKQKEELCRKELDLAHLRDYPVDRKGDIDEAVISWQGLRAVALEAGKRLSAAAVAQELVSEYERLEAEVGSLSGDDLERLTGLLRAPVVGAFRRALRAVGRAITMALRWVWRQLIALARWVLHTVVRRETEVHVEEDEHEQAEESKRSAYPESLSPDQVSAVLDRHRRFQEIAPLVRKYLGEKAETEAAESRAELAAQSLREALGDLVDDLSDLERAYRVFCDRVEGHRELATIAGQLKSLEGERSSLQEAVGRFEREQERLGRLESGLGEQLRQTTGRSGALEDLVEAFQDGCRRRHLHDEAKRGLREGEERKGIILQGQSPSELQAALDKARRELEHLRASNPSLEGARTSETRESLEELLSRQQDDLHQREVRITGLRTKIDTQLARLRPRAEVEEELERYTQQVSTLARFGDELTIAIDVITQAMSEAHRDFAPSVGRFLSGGLARVTANRYQHVLLDPSTLRLTTEVPETHRLEDVELLSRGTRAAAYLLLRVGLAQHMSSMGEPVPLILDDPLVDLDDVRVENFLDLLLELSHEVQILLFSKGEGTKAWFGRRCGRSAPHKITLLPAPRSASSSAS
ncbi:MAG: AAA family ATPase [Dehalococcoidia bacterium]|nr:AAA family ATPase [Dehalococcoidia bacterium]